MPTILAIDTSTDACSVALQSSRGIEQSLSITPREHTQRVLPMVEQLLAAHQCSLSELDAIAVSIGPGSFTGLRIGLSIAQGLAYGADLPLVAVSTLDTMAQTALRLYQPTVAQVIVPVIDARMDEVYWSRYDVTAPVNKAHTSAANAKALSLREQPCVSSPDAIVTDIDMSESANIIAVGSGWSYAVLQQYCQQQPTLFSTIEIDFYPQAHDLAILAERVYLNGDTVNPLDAAPVYLRDEVSWKKRQKIRKS